MRVARLQHQTLCAVFARPWEVMKVLALGGISHVFAGTLVMLLVVFAVPSPPKEWSCTAATAGSDICNSEIGLTAPSLGGLDNSAGLVASRKPNLHVVVSRMLSDEITWLRELRGISHELYTEGEFADTQPGLRRLHGMAKPRSRTGVSTHECGGILSYIVRNYDNLPNVTVFLHGHPLRGIFSRMQEHRDFHSDPHIFHTIRAMANSSDKISHCSLNTMYLDWRLPSEPPWYVRGWRKEFARRRGFEDVRRILSPLIPSQGTCCFCCSQFAVSRARIHLHPPSFYKQLLAFVQDALDDTDSGCNLLEFVWHLIFGEPAVCPLEENSCRNLYGGTGIVYRGSYFNGLWGEVHNNIETAKEQHRQASSQNVRPEIGFVQRRPPRMETPRAVWE